MTRLSALFAMVACAGNEVKLAPLPTKLVAVTTPAFPNLILLPTLICVEDVTIHDTTRPSSSPPMVPDPLTCTDIIPPYTTVQTDPFGIVTTTFDPKVIGPALIAFFPFDIE